MSDILLNERISLKGFKEMSLYHKLKDIQSGKILVTIV